MNDKNDIDSLIDNKLKKIIDKIEWQKKNLPIITANIIYSRLESLFWLQKRLSIQGQLPPLSGWPAAPDFLLRLHTWVSNNKPEIVVETGSGVTTLVIADALRKNGFGKLISLEHLNEYAEKTLRTLEVESLSTWVDLRVGSLVEWHGDHLNPKDSVKQSRWYPSHLIDLDKIDLLIVDGPPGSTCRYARYPALPAFYKYLTPTAEVWMDDANRQEEKEISQVWAERYGFISEYFPLEKGLSLLSRPNISKSTSSASNPYDHALGLDFSIPEERN